MLNDDKSAPEQYGLTRYACLSYQRQNVDRMDEILQTWSLGAPEFTGNQLWTAAEVPEVGWRTMQ